ncbi:MAG: IspD/TarI family cytidylyltransferase [Pseudonocardia sp.]
MDVLAVVAAQEQDFVLLAGVPIVCRSVRLLLAVDVVRHVMVLIPDEHRERAVRTCAGLPVTVRTGAGDLAPSTGIVLMHEATRALAPSALAVAVLDAVRAGHRAAVPVLPLADTVKRVDASGRVRAASDRSALRVVQSPVAFRADLMRGGELMGGGGNATALDLVRACALADDPVHPVPGDPMAFPVRTPWEVELAEMFMARAL